MLKTKPNKKTLMTLKYLEILMAFAEWLKNLSTAIFIMFEEFSRF